VTVTCLKPNLSIHSLLSVCRPSLDACWLGALSVPRSNLVRAIQSELYFLNAHRQLISIFGSQSDHSLALVCLCSPKEVHRFCIWGALTQMSPQLQSRPHEHFLAGNGSCDTTSVSSGIEFSLTYPRHPLETISPWYTIQSNHVGILRCERPVRIFPQIQLARHRRTHETSEIFLATQRSRSGLTYRCCSLRTNQNRHSLTSMV